jgi:deoxycytidine triphosphate deaminase
MGDDRKVRTMVLGVDKLLELVKKDNLVEGLSERELTNPEGAGFDLRLGKVHKISGEAYLGNTHRKTTKVDLVFEYDPNNLQVYALKPGESILVTTVEKVNMPLNLTANMWARGTLYRSGVVLSGGNIAPGYCGELSFTLANCGQVNVEIEMGARIVHILFFEVLGKSNEYRGQWKGGRVNAVKLEKQV